jgi:hypothetical protein
MDLFQHEVTEGEMFAFLADITRVIIDRDSLTQQLYDLM